MKTSLTSRFAVILVTVILAAWAVWAIPPRLGIDLAGGTSLLYELDLTKTPDVKDSSALAQQVIDVLRKRVDPGNQKNMIWRVVGGKRIQIQMPLPDKETLAARDANTAAVKALQDTALKQSEVARAIGLPAGGERDKAITALAAPGTERNKLLQALAKANDAYEAAKAEAAKYPVTGTMPPAVMEQNLTARDALDNAQQAVNASNVDVQWLQGALTAADNPKNTKAAEAIEAMIAAHKEQEKEIRAVVAAHKKLMELSGGGVDSPEDLKRMVTGAGVLDFRITVNADELGLKPGLRKSDALQQAEEALQKYGKQRQIQITGMKVRWFEIDPDGRDNFKGGYVTTEWQGQPYVLCYDEHERSLTHGDAAYKPWSVTARAPQPDPNTGDLTLPFNMDNVGAKYMEGLTSANKGRMMAILLDDRAMSAPRIITTIGEHGSITFGEASETRSMEMIKKEADNLKQIMDAGSLPATLQPEPISVMLITPTMGQDNIKAGIHSAFYAVGAVMAFMLVYYTITGFFADAALMMNLLLVLAVMASFRGTFTLPGIAGLVLTLGMAVDANVLINERIREEIHKGASLWMAIKQGYDRVFWTIFDANLTTSLTSIVLIYVGSEEVKGFGITLLIGLMIHMFTALFVTRTLMMAGVRWGIIRGIDDHSIVEYFKEILTFTWLRNGHFPFMRVITVTNFDWIGKRKIFWWISGVITAAGLIAFVIRGTELPGTLGRILHIPALVQLSDTYGNTAYDIEFRGGTQVTLQLKKGTELSLDEVRLRIHSLVDKTIPDAKDPTKQVRAFSDLSDVVLYGVGRPEEHRFEMQTTLANTKEEPAFVSKYLLPTLAEKFSDVLELKRKISIADWNPNNPIPPQVDVTPLMEKGAIVPITKGTLDQVFEGKGVTSVPHTDVADYRGGVAVLLDQINPPQTLEQLKSRIESTRQSQEPAIKAIPHRKFDIIPILAASGGAASAPESAAGVPVSDVNDPRPLTRAVMVSVDTSQTYDENSESVWKDRVATTEWRIVQTALSDESLFQGVTSFDAVVAGQAKQSALIAIMLSLVLIVIYVWIRFGGIRYGLGAILSLVHDAVVAVAGTVLSGVAVTYLFGGHPFLLITDFKINLTMIAAYLTVIGYSVNDTIVIFDRVRELRGKSQAALSAKLINDAINQCFGRTIWTTFTVFIVVLIMYVWGGEGVRGFAFAMLIGVFTGAYSTLAIASPMLLRTKMAEPKGGGGAALRVNPFLAQPALEPEPQLNPFRKRPADEEGAPGPAPA